jgi:hypothetical protein
MSQNGFKVFLKSHTKFYGFFFPKYFSQAYGAKGLKACDCKMQPVLQKFKKIHMSKSATFWQNLDVWV